MTYPTITLKHILFTIQVFRILTQEQFIFPFNESVSSLESIINTIK